jgi:glycine betaine/proline transport system permease protein
VATVSQRPGSNLAGLRTPPLGRPARAALIVAAVAVLYVALRGEFPWPSGLTWGLNERMDTVYEWIVDNQNTNVVFLYFFNYISNFLDWLVRSLTDLLTGMTWVGVTVAATAATLRWCGLRVALLVLAAFAAFALMGVWEAGMATLALMVAGVLVSLAIGVPLGVLAGRSDRFQSAITPVLDAMQIVPAFAYLMPVVILFSVGYPAAVIATVVYAIPPAVRITALGIRGVPREAVEAAESLGATGRQVLTKVQLPLARRAIMLGVNQTIMMALSIVVIASLIGGGGLGDVVVSALTYLDVGEAMIGGAAIVIMAIALDRSTAAAGDRVDRGPRHTTAAGARRLRLLTFALPVGILATVLVARAQAWAASIRTR